MDAIDTPYEGMMIKPVPALGLNKDKSLSQLLQQYIDIQNTLEEYAEVIPEDADKFVKSELQQFVLLDEQAALLEAVFTMPILTLEDAKVKMTLWEREVLASKSEHDISAADQLTKSIFDFVKSL